MNKLEGQILGGVIGILIFMVVILFIQERKHDYRLKCIVADLKVHKIALASLRDDD